MATESVAKEVLSDSARLKAGVRQSMPDIDCARTPQELQALMLYRRASEADKKRLLKLARAGVAGKLPSVKETSAMTLDQLRAHVDGLPEAFA